ncbi:MAG: hypothetical protein EOO41_01730 [Methanobacteriota archaeon]|nr:MAG: hypothetical protein EOO41_01730 [Euryarchaeota archaeon]
MGWHVAALPLAVGAEKGGRAVWPTRKGRQFLLNTASQPTAAACIAAAAVRTCEAAVVEVFVNMQSVTSVVHLAK